MTGTDLDGAAPRIVRVDVMAMDHPRARLGRVAEQLLNDASGTWKFPPRGSVVDRRIHLLSHRER